MKRKNVYIQKFDVTFDLMSFDCHDLVSIPVRFASCVGKTNANHVTYISIASIPSCYLFICVRMYDIYLWLWYAHESEM